MLSPFLLGLSLADSFLNQLIPDVDFDPEDCDGDACLPRNQLLHLDRSRTDATGKLVFRERSMGYASKRSILAACLPGVARTAVADSFQSCKGKKMEDICVLAKRGWLVQDSNAETVANLDLLTTSFNGIKGGAEAVKKCMKIKEETADLDDYYYYDYDYYYDEYDYLEEGEGLEVRRKREVGKKGEKSGKRSKKRSGKKPGRKSNKSSGKKSGKGSNKRSEKKAGKRSNKRKGKKGGKKKNGSKKSGKNEKKERKFVKKTDKQSARNDAKINARLAKLGFTKMPKKSTLNELECMWEELENLLVGCAEKLASNTP